MQKIGKLALITVAFVWAVIPLLSQAPPAATKPSFEVTSVKPAAPGNGFRGGGPRGNSYTMTGVPLRVLVQIAYQRIVPSGQGALQLQINGAPNWMDSEMYDVQAKADCSSGPISREQMQLMVQSLLEERFHLKAHYETHELPIYNLVVAKEGKLKLSDNQTASPIQAGPPTLCGAQPAQLPPPGQRGIPFDPRGPISSFPRGATIIMMNPTTGMTMTGAAVGVGALAGLLQGQAGRPVIDKTNLKGLFDIQLNFAPENLPTPIGGPLQTPFGAIGAAPAGPGAGATPNAAADPIPSLFTALQEQLGLKLESTKGPVEALVIDSVQKPTEN